MHFPTNQVAKDIKVIILKKTNKKYRNFQADTVYNWERCSLIQTDRNPGFYYILLKFTNQAIQDVKSVQATIILQDFSLN